MSSFNIGGPNNRPQVTEAQNMMNNGGAGNTGYMQSRKKKKKKEEEMMDPSILDGEIEDKFEYIEDEYEDDDDYYNTSSYDASNSDDTFEREGTKKESEKTESKGAKNVVFGLIDKFADRIVDKNKTAAKKKRDDYNPGGDFLSLSGKDI